MDIEEIKRTEHQMVDVIRESDEEQHQQNG